jgi:hypothetical protein
MSVPNTNTFTLQDVTGEIGIIGVDSLQECFDNANSAGFDPAYAGSKNQLLNFRNYNHSASGNSVQVSPTGKLLDDQAQSFNLVITTSPAGLSWTSSNLGNSWITITPSSGSGSQTVSVAVTANNTGVTRNGTAQINIIGGFAACAIAQSP